MSTDLPTAPPPPAADGAELPDSLAAVFRRVLELAEVPVDGDFFLLGGDSLVATRVLSAVARAYGVELSFEDFLADPTPAGLAGRITAVRTSTGTGLGTDTATGTGTGTGTADRIAASR